MECITFLATLDKDLLEDKWKPILDFQSKQKIDLFLLHAQIASPPEHPQALNGKRRKGYLNYLCV